MSLPFFLLNSLTPCRTARVKELLLKKTAHRTYDFVLPSVVFKQILYQITNTGGQGNAEDLPELIRGYRQTIYLNEFLAVTKHRHDDSNESTFGNIFKVEVHKITSDFC